jgi:hypothetical protein
LTSGAVVLAFLLGEDFVVEEEEEDEDEEEDANGGGSFTAFASSCLRLRAACAA